MPGRAGSYKLRLDSIKILRLTKECLRALITSISISARTPREEMDLFDSTRFRTSSRPQIWVDFDMPQFTAICPFSDFPDFGVIRLNTCRISSASSSKSLKLYINSFRHVKIFHEHVVNVILEDFIAACDPTRSRDRGRV